MRILIQVLVCLLILGPVAGASLENKDYAVTVDATGSIHVTERTTGFACRFEPEFVILATATDPQLRLRPVELPLNYNVPTWKLDGAKIAGDVFQAKTRSVAQFGDGFDDRILSSANTAERTANLFAAGRKRRIRAIECVSSERTFEFFFEPVSDFHFNARLTLPPVGPPELSYAIVPKVEAYYSIGYTGAPEYDPESVDEIWQPMIWNGKRFPDQSYLTLAFRCPLPTAMVQAAGATIGVLADPSEFAFDPLPTLERSRFGIAVRNEAGKAQAMLFAPVLGGSGSRLSAGEAFTFTLRLIVEPSSIVEAYETIARRDFGFRDYRDNALGSLNDVIDRMVDYGMSEYANFIPELKGCSYSTDVPDAVKNVSSLNPLNMALLRDNVEIFEDRAYPIIEYMMSREKFLFALDREQKIQNPSRRMAGPAAPMSELASLYMIGQEANPVFLKYAEDLSGQDRILNLDLLVPGGRWQNFLALYLATGNADSLARAQAGADAYIQQHVNEPASTFDDNPFFWTAFVQDFPWLTELYEATGEDRYLQAARMAARRFCFYIWMSPAIPDSPVLVNQGNKAPVYWYLKRYREEPMEIQEEWAPAWRLSEIGLTPESTGTSSGHRAILMANFAPWFLRIAYHANDPFLHDVARAAVVGRYRNFPGYHINTDRTTIYEKADYPLREHNDLNVNSFHYNHIWPQISFLFDFIVTDALAKSHSAIEFPAAFIEGYAYLQNRFYGHKPGKFYGYDDAVLWMPKNLFSSSSGQLNGLSARGEGRVYLAFMNQSDLPVHSDIHLNRSLMGADPGALPVQLWVNNQPVESRPLEGDNIAVQVPPKGIVALAIGDVSPKAEFQNSILSMSMGDAWEKDFIESDFGGLRAMILNWGPDRTRAYIYLRADDSEFSSVTLKLPDGTSIEDDSYPYEFTVPVSAEADDFSFQIQTTTVDEASLGSEVFTLIR